MTNKKILIQIFIVSAFFLVLNFSSVEAVRMVPKLDPLQPIPQDTLPNITQNINTENNEIDRNQKIEQQQIETGGALDSGTIQNIKTGQDNLTKTYEMPIRSAGYYWALIIFGLTGLVLAGLIVYRKIKKK